jgi:hypothetical protein
MIAPQITVFPEYGYTYATPFNFKLSDEILALHQTFLWNFGDGEFSRRPNPTHTYNYPKKYTVIVNGYNKDGTYEVYTTELNVILYLNESIYFENVPPPTFASHYNKYPFKINITSSNTKKHIIDLSTQFSKSYQKQLPINKWSFLRPEWRFLDLNGNIIESIETVDTPIKINKYGKIDNINGTTVGVTGTAEFYLVDDLYNIDYIQNKSPYTTIIATLQTSAIKSFHDSFNLDENLPSYSNSIAVAVMPHVFTWRYPDYIDITENGIRGYIKNRWSETKHPLLTKFSFNETAYFDDNIGNGVKLYNPEINFCHYVPFNNSYTESLTVSICGISSNIIPQPLEINFIDPNTGFKSSGYYKGYFNTEDISAKNVSIIAESTIKTPLSLSANYYSPVLWVSNPAAGMAATIQYFYNDWIEDISTKNLNRVHIKPFDIPIVRPITTALFLSDSHPLSGFHGVYSIAALPAPEYTAWMCDSENNFLYKVSTIGEILCSIDLVDLFYKNNLTFLVKQKLFGVVSPAAISLDSNQNIWISLYDSLSCIKLDKYGNFLNLASPMNSITYNISGTGEDFYDLFLENSDGYQKTDDYDFNLIEPTGIDTDINDNVWVSYSNMLSGLLIKYNKDGTLLKTISYPLCSCPKEVKCDSTGNVWIAGNQFNITHELVPPTSARYLTGFLEKRNSTGQLISSFGPFNGINHLTLDNNENPWFTYSYHWIANINNITGRTRKLKIISDGYSDNVPEWTDPNVNVDDTALEGIGCDLFGNVFVINSIENKILIIDSNEFTIKDYFNLNPKGFVYFNENFDENGITKLEFNYWSKSAQAQGDWTGLRWVKKYADKKLSYLFNNTETLKLSGKVDNLNFYLKNPYEFFKTNENYDLVENMKNISFQPALRDSEFLFKDFLGSIFGKYPFEHDDLGIHSYEKISNFVQNQSDVDTCNIEYLYDLSNSVDINSDDFKLSFPLGVKKLIDNLSINQSKLWGGNLNDRYNFKSLNENNNFNRGYKINSNFYTVTAGTPLILKTKSLNEYKLIDTGYYYESNTPILSALTVGLSTYPISNLCKILNLGDDWNLYYEFYEFLPSNNSLYVDGIIDWNNPQTLLSKNLSSYDDWIKDEGIMDTLFSYELYKGLGLLT